MNSRDFPDWADLPEEMQTQFGDEETYEQWKVGQDDMVFDMDSKIAVAADLLTIVGMAKAFPSPDGEGLNRQLKPVVVDRIDPKGVNVLKPIMIHRHVDEQDAEPHMRALAMLKLRGQDAAVEYVMDVPMDAWNQLPNDAEFRQNQGLAPREEPQWDSFLAKFWSYVDRGESDEPQARGPYGTNEGDKWLGEGSDVQKQLDAEGRGVHLVHEMMRQEDGSLEESMYVTDDDELIEEARQGTERWVAEQASRN